MKLNILGSAELGKMAIDVTRCAKTKKANYCLKNINLRAGISFWHGFEHLQSRSRAERNLCSLSTKTWHEYTKVPF